jgi:hypothetical protein
MLAETTGIFFWPYADSTTGGINIVEVFESLTTSFERWTHRCLADI